MAIDKKVLETVADIMDTIERLHNEADKLLISESGGKVSLCSWQPTLYAARVINEDCSIGPQLINAAALHEMFDGVTLDNVCAGNAFYKVPVGMRNIHILLDATPETSGGAANDVTADSQA